MNTRVMRRRGCGINPPKQAPCTRMKGVREVTLLAPTKTTPVWTQPIDTYGVHLLLRSGLGPRSIGLHISQSNRLTDPTLDIVSTMTTLYMDCTVNALVMIRERPAL